MLHLNETRFCTQTNQLLVVRPIAVCFSISEQLWVFSRLQFACSGLNPLMSWRTGCVSAGGRKESFSPLAGYSVLRYSKRSSGICISSELLQTSGPYIKQRSLSKMAPFESASRQRLANNVLLHIMQRRRALRRRLWRPVYSDDAQHSLGRSAVRSRSGAYPKRTGPEFEATSSGWLKKNILLIIAAFGGMFFVHLEGLT